MQRCSKWADVALPICCSRASSSLISFPAITNVCLVASLFLSFSSSVVFVFFPPLSFSLPLALSLSLHCFIPFYRIFPSIFPSASPSSPLLFSPAPLRAIWPEGDATYRRRAHLSVLGASGLSALPRLVCPRLFTQAKTLTWTRVKAVRRGARGGQSRVLLGHQRRAWRWQLEPL